MISGIKVYRPDGSLKKEICKTKALKLYDEQNKSNWCLSKAEQKWWKGFKEEDTFPKDNSKQGLKPWIKRSYKKRDPIYKIKCQICDKEKMMQSADAKFCSPYCSCVNRRRNARALYALKKQNGTLLD